MDNTNKTRTAKQNLVGKIYKLLPIYEGKLMYTNERLEESVAYNNFQKNINMLMLYLMGIKCRYGINEYLESIVLTLSGLKTVGIGNHKLVKSTVFACMELAEKMANEYGLFGLDLE